MPKKKDEFLDIQSKASVDSYEKQTVSTLSNSELLSVVERLEKQLKELSDGQKTLRRRLTWMAVGSYIRLLLFLIPVILGILFLPRIFSGIFEEYGSLIGDLQLFPPGVTTEILNTDQNSKTSNPSEDDENIVSASDEPQSKQNFIERALNSVVEQATQNVISQGIRIEDLEQAVKSASPAQKQLFLSKYPQLADEVTQLQNGTYSGSVEQIITQIDPADLQLFLNQ